MACSYHRRKTLFSIRWICGIDPEEYYNGSSRITEFLHKSGSDKERWESPVPDANLPEAEWGLEPKITLDLEQWDNIRRIERKILKFSHPQSMSLAIADLYKKLYEEEKISTEKLIIDSFNVISPLLTIRKGCVPFWLVFNTKRSYEKLQSYINSEHYKFIYMMMISPGKESIGAIAIQKWKDILKRASQKGKFIGTSSEEYPYDLGIYARYSKEFNKVLPDIEVPGPLKVRKCMDWLQNSKREDFSIEIL